MWTSQINVDITNAHAVYRFQQYSKPTIMNPVISKNFRIINCYIAVRICIWSTNKAVFKYFLNVPNVIDIALTSMWISGSGNLWCRLFWCACVYGTTSCPDDADLSCERPWTADTELNRLFKYSGAPACWHRKLSIASLYVMRCVKLNQSQCRLFAMRSVMLEWFDILRIKRVDDRRTDCSFLNRKSGDPASSELQ